MKKITLFIVMVVFALTNNTAFGQGSWSLQTNPTSSAGSSIQFVSATEGWIDLTNNSLLHTTNGGTNWNVVTPNSSDAVFGMDAPGSRLSFINSTTGWVIKTNGNGDTPQGVILYKTTNSGTNWQKTVLSTTAGDAGIQVQFVDANNGWILIYNMSSGTPKFFKTTDGGSNWTTTNGGGIFYYVNTTTGYAFAAGPSMDPPYTFYKTTDGGTSWTPQYVDNTNGGYNAIHFSDANHGWIVGDNGKVVKTTDGTNWTPVTNTGTNTDYVHTEVDFINNNEGWIATKNYTAISNPISVLHTTNGGATWSTQPLPFDYIVFAMDFWDTNNGWATQDFGPIAKYSVSTGTYSNATLNGPWFVYTDINPIDPYNDNLNYLVFDGNGAITAMNGFGGPWTGNYTVSSSGVISGNLTDGSENYPISGQLTSTTEGTSSLGGQNWKMHKVANPGALKDKIQGTITVGGDCGERNITINIDNNGQVISATGLIGPVTGRIYTDLGVFIGHFNSGEPSNGWHEFSIFGYYNSSSNILTGQLSLDMSSCNTGTSVSMVRSNNLAVNEFENSDNNMIVYPNPNNGSFYFDVKEPKAKLQIEIYNFLGQKVYETVNYDQKIINEINFDPQNAGIHYIKIYDGENVFKEKILIH